METIRRRRRKKKKRRKRKRRKRKKRRRMIKKRRRRKKRKTRNQLLRTKATLVASNNPLILTLTLTSSNWKCLTLNSTTMKVRRRLPLSNLFVLLTCSKLRLVSNKCRRMCLKVLVRSALKLGVIGIGTGIK